LSASTLPQRPLLPPGLWLDHQKSARSFAQTPDGFAAFQAALGSTAVQPAKTLIVLEATGSYWISPAVALHQTGYALSVVNPAPVHAFARSLPRRAKTDALDAQLLTQFAAERVPPRWTPRVRRRAWSPCNMRSSRTTSC